MALLNSNAFQAETEAVDVKMAAFRKQNARA